MRKMLTGLQWNKDLIVKLKKEYKNLIYSIFDNDRDKQNIYLTDWINPNADTYLK